MKTVVPLAAAMILASTAAFAQTTTTTPPAATTPAPSVTTTAPPATAPVLTDAQANAWINKTVYSSDAKNVGEVSAVQRGASRKVTELHADIGGFLGLGETRVRIMPAQFKLEGDRIILNMTAEQVRALPKIAK